MRFIECNIENFGKLHGFRYSFDKGLNTVIAENGYGKTTLTVFIKCMLYGMEDTKRASLEENDRKHYMPWQGGRCGGSLSLELGGKRYRIERTFAPKAADDEFRLYNLDTGMPSEDFPSNLGEEALGIDREGFERTIFLSERNLSGKNDNKSISAKLSDLVGCDGDIGGMDAAMKRLEEQRKYYKKTGGRGLIDELGAKITECELEISSLERRKDGTLQLEERLSAERGELVGLEEKKKRLEEERAALQAKKSKTMLSEQYAERAKALERERERLESLKLFFGEKIPTAEEIDRARYSLDEAKNLEKTASYYGESREYTELSARFSGKTDISEIERAAVLADDLDAKRARLSENSPTEPRRAKYFSKKVPESEKLATLKKRLSDGDRFALILGIILTVASIPLFLVLLPVGSAVLAVGVILIAISVINKSKSRRSVEEFLAEISDEPAPSSGELRAYLDFLTEKLAEYNRERAEYERSTREYNALLEEITLGEAKIRELLSRVGDCGEGELQARLRAVREEYLRYYRISVEAERGAASKSDALAKAASLRRGARELLARYATATDSPFEELKSALTEYNYLLTSTAEKARECAALRERYGIEDGGDGFDPARLVLVDSRIAECEESLTAKRREIASLESRINDENDSYERIFELRERREELRERREAAIEGLEVIVATKTFLGEARNNMTAKYLGKTRAGFTAYREMIEGAVEREFTLDTSFSLTVTDVGGSHTQDAYSKGTRDLYALATRLALSDALYEGELPPLILDDPFSALDDKKLTLALRVVREMARKRQVLYFTCQNGRAPS